MKPLFRRPVFWAGAAGLLVLGSLLWGLGPVGESGLDGPVQPMPYSVSGATGNPGPAPAHTAQDLPSAAAVSDGRKPTLPADIETQMLDTALWRARGGDPVLNADLIRIFEQILGRAAASSETLLADRIPAEYLAQAQRLLSQYKLYRESLSGIRPADYGTQPSQMLEGVLNARRQLQSQFFSPDEVAGLFEEDNRYDAFTVERLRIGEREDLSLAQKAAMISARSSALLSPAQQEARQAAVLPASILGQNAAMAEAGLTPEQRQLERTARFGADAAARMAEVDRQEAAWKQRIARLAQADGQTQQQMRKTDFTPAEQLRLDAALSLYRAEQQRLQTK